jgi:hypothetical protein
VRETAGIIFENLFEFSSWREVNFYTEFDEFSNFLLIIQNNR